MTGYRVGAVGWSDHEIDTIKKRWAKGHSALQIAMDLPGRSRNAIIGKLHRMGLSHKGRGAPTMPTRATYNPNSKPRSKPKAKPAPIPGVAATLSWSSPQSTAEDQRVFAEEGHTATARVERGVGVDSPNARPFVEAKGGCKWPLGERYAILNCCNPVAGGDGAGKVYCAGHAKIAVAAVQPHQMRSREASRLTRFERVERDIPAPRPTNDRSIWDEAREAA